jgi:hypothetical protein
MKVGDHIISTCGSLYRGCEGVITEVHSPEGLQLHHEYSVAITTPANAVLPEMTRACLFDGSQFVRKDADLGRDFDNPCRDCCCRMGGHTAEVLP